MAKAAPGEFILYHKDTPDGRIFKPGERSKESLAKDGWVDNPAKLGRDIYENGDMKRIEHLQQRLLAGAVLPIEDERSAAEQQRLTGEAIDGLMSERDAAQQALEEFVKKAEKQGELSQADIENAKQIMARRPRPTQSFRYDGKGNATEKGANALLRGKDGGVQTPPTFPVDF